MVLDKDFRQRFWKKIWKRIYRERLFGKSIFEKPGRSTRLRVKGYSGNKLTDIILYKKG